MNETQTTMLINALRPYLEKEAENDAELQSAMQKENKSEKELADYLVHHYTHCEAKSVIADGNEVMALAIQYYKDDSIVMPSLSAKPKPKAETKPAKNKPTEPKAKAEKKTSPKPKAKEIPMIDMFAEF